MPLLPNWKRIKIPPILPPTFGDPINQIAGVVVAQNAGSLAPITHMTITGQGSSSTLVQAAPLGEGTTPDGADYRCLVAYTTNTYGAAGGPQAGHQAIRFQISPGNYIILGYLV